MKKLLLISLAICFSTYSFAQNNLGDFNFVEKHKIKKTTVKVYFDDPLVEIIEDKPDFNNFENKEKHNVLSGYLHNNSIYVFETSRKKEVEKYYVLKGDPNKLKTKYFYKLEVYNSHWELEKVIGKINVGGNFFENMQIFQSKEGSKLVGKTVNLWGYYSMVVPFEDVKEKIDNIILMDIENRIPENYLLKELEITEGLFDYQHCGLKNIAERDIMITVLEYDDKGNITNEYPRLENDTNLYLSSISKDLIMTAIFPLFTVEDTMIQEDNMIFVNSVSENINYYFEDVKVTLDDRGENIIKIEAKLKIHGYNYVDDIKTLHYENYIAEFGKVGDCFLPIVAKFCPLSDTEYLQPRIIIGIEYTLK